MASIQRLSHPQKLKHVLSGKIVESLNLFLLFFLCRNTISHERHFYIIKIGQFIHVIISRSFTAPQAEFQQFPIDVTSAYALIQCFDDIVTELIDTAGQFRRTHRLNISIQKFTDSMSAALQNPADIAITITCIIQLMDIFIQLDFLLADVYPIFTYVRRFFLLQSLFRLK